MTTIDIERVARMWCGVRANMPVEIVDGDAPPKVCGEGFHWTTPGGKPIRYPNAYKWEKVYHASTIRVEVGRNWRHDVRELVVDGQDTYVREQFRDFDGLRIARGWLSHGSSGWSRIWAIRDPQTGRAYHGRRSSLEGRWDGLAEAIAEARATWTVRAENEREQAVLAELSVIAEPLVTRADSKAAGNCGVGTEAYAARRGWTDRYYVRAELLDRAPEPRARAAAQAARRMLARIIADQQTA